MSKANLPLPEFPNGLATSIPGGVQPGRPPLAGRPGKHSPGQAPSPGSLGGLPHKGGEEQTRSFHCLPRWTAVLLLLVLLVEAGWAADGAPAFSAAEKQARYQKYVQAYRQYLEAEKQKPDAARMQKLGDLLRSSQADYEEAIGGPAFAPNPFVDAALPEGTLKSATGADGVLSAASQPATEAKVRSAEEKEFDALIGRLYGPERQKRPDELLATLQAFLKRARNPRLVMDATFELATLLAERKRETEARSVLEAYARRAPTAEARRLALARARLLVQESRIGAQRKVFEDRQEAAIAAWRAYSQTSWFALPVKMVRLGSYFWANVKRRKEAAEVKKLREGYAEIEKQTYPAGTLDDFTHSRLVPCNDVTLLVNGRAAFARRFELAESARERICLQTLLYHDDQTGNKLTDLLIRKAQEGVEVKVITDDAFAGSRKSGILRRLQNGGVEVLINNPIFRHLFRANYRSHQKIFLIDDEVAIVGGMNVANEYALGEIEEYGWRDTDAEIRGPAVADIAELFDWNWEALILDKRFEQGQPPYRKPSSKEEKLPILPKRDKLIRGPLPQYFPEPPRFENVRVRFVKTFPLESKDDDILDLFTAYLKTCRREATFESAYFIPTPALEQAIIAAIKRGVRVKLLTNSVESNNHPNAGWAGRANYGNVIAAGAELYEWQGAQTVHSKVSLFDDFAVTLGAYNVNSRSHSCDSEDVLALEDPRVARAMKQALTRDFLRARRVTQNDLDTWRSSFVDRLKLDFFNLFKSIF